MVLLAVPIYNYDGNAAAKDLIELTGGTWEDKIAGFACAAGGASSYMSIMVKELADRARRLRVTP